MLQRIRLLASEVNYPTDLAAEGVAEDDPINEASLQEELGPESLRATLGGLC